MKTLLSAAVVVLFASVQAAHAAPPRSSHLDEHATLGVDQAREIRAMIVGRFSTSRDYRELVREADELVDSMNEIHHAVHDRRSNSTLRQMVLHARGHLQNLDRRIGRSDYLQSNPGHRVLTPTGYISYPPTHHAGNVHVASMQRMLDRLSSNLRQLESDVQPTFRIDRRPYTSGYGSYGGW